MNKFDFEAWFSEYVNANGTSKAVIENLFYADMLKIEKLLLCKKRYQELVQSSSPVLKETHIKNLLKAAVDFNADAYNVLFAFFAWRYEDNYYEVKRRFEVYKKAKENRERYESTETKKYEMMAARSLGRLLDRIFDVERINLFLN